MTLNSNMTETLGIGIVSYADNSKTSILGHGKAVIRGGKIWEKSKTVIVGVMDTRLTNRCYRGEMMIPELMKNAEVFGDGRIDRYSYPFMKTDGGRSSSKRPRQDNDCTVKALTMTTELLYDEAYDILKDAGRKCSRGFRLSDWLNKNPLAEYQFTKIPFPAKKGEKRMNPHSFSRQFQDGRYIVKTAKHVFAFIDGVAHDEFAERPDRCIYTAWKIEES